MYYICIVVPVIPLPVFMLVMKPGFLFYIVKDNSCIPNI